MRALACAVLLLACESRIDRPSNLDPPPPPRPPAPVPSGPPELSTFHGLTRGRKLGPFMLVAIDKKGPSGALLHLRLERDVLVFELQPQSDPRPAPAHAGGLSIYFHEPRRGEFTQQEIDDGLKGVVDALRASDAGSASPPDAGPRQPPMPAASGLPV